MVDIKLGPTGRYAQDKPLREGDQGQLAVGIRVVKEQRMVVMRFGAVLEWLALPLGAAHAQAAAFRALVHQNFGRLPYDAATLPLRVTKDTAKGVLYIHLPQPAEVLAGNPEVFLALAERMEEVAGLDAAASHSPVAGRA